MKKICFVTTIYVTYRCFLKQLSEFLYKTGEYDVSLICNKEDGIEQDIPEFVRFYPVKMQRGVSLSAVSAINQMQQIFTRERFDIVQYSTPNASLYASIAAKKAKIPVRLYCQWGIRYMGFDSSLKQSLFKRLEKITCDNSTFIEVESHNIRNFGLKEALYSEEKSVVIWNGSASGVDLRKFDINQKDKWRNEIRDYYKIDNSDIVFIFVGRLTKDKGVNELLEAFLNLSGTHKNIKLFMCGGMDDHNSLDKELFEKAEHNNNIIFTSSVNDIERYYAASDVFVSPSYREGFGLVVIEAESMGLPALVSNVPGQIDAIIEQETGVPCEVKNSNSLQTAMEWMLLNPSKCSQMGENASIYVKENYEQTLLFKKIKDQRDLLVSKSNAQKSSKMHNTEREI